MEVKDETNLLLSTSKTSDSQPQIQLHPLVILTISDCITRHVLRGQKDPIVGAILGDQHGRDITMEFAYECKLKVGYEDGGGVVMDGEWFDSRLQHFKDVHRTPALDLVGWFTIGSPRGPDDHHLPIHNHILQVYNESALLLLFHPSSVADGTAKGGRLPLAIYESVYEAATGSDDKSMQTSGDGSKLALRFREISYTIDTAEAEMIGIDSIAAGGTSAAVSQESAKADLASPSKDKGKGTIKSRDKPKANPPSTPDKAIAVLSTEEESQIASLTAKANAIRMLQQRIALIKSYLESLPPSYVTQPPPQDASPLRVQNIATNIEVPHVILRQIFSLLARLPLLARTPAREAESTAQSFDVALTRLLSSMGSAIHAMQRMGQKAAVFENSKFSKEQQQQHRGHGDWEVGGDGFGPSGALGNGNDESETHKAHEPVPDQWELMED